MIVIRTNKTRQDKTRQGKAQYVRHLNVSMICFERVGAEETAQSVLALQV